MVKVVYNDALKAEYRHMFSICAIKASRRPFVNMALRKIMDGELRYLEIANQYAMPWIFLGCIHLMESGCNFNRQLHNGDSLNSRTIHVPKGRPPLPLLPPFTFEQSAKDALDLFGFDKWKDWTIEGILWSMEKWNGLGYRQYHPNVKSPYLWAATSLYTKGKYVSDTKFSPNAVSQQIGIAAILQLAIQTNVWKPIPG